MASEALFAELAKALSQPSRAYRTAQAALDIPEQALKGYLQGGEVSDTLRQRKLAQTRLGELLPNIPSDLSNLTTEGANAITKPVEAYAALQKALADKGTTPRFQQGNFNVGGHLTRFNPYTGEYEYADQPGVIVKPGQKITPVDANTPSSPSAITGVVNPEPRVPPTIPATESDKLADLNSMKEALATMKKNFSPDFVGPVNARKLAVSQTINAPSIGLGATSQGALFTQATQDLKDRLLRARSGAQINEQEYQRLVSLVPDQYKSVPDFLAKTQRFQQVLDSTISSKRQELMRAGYRGASTLPNNRPTNTSEDNGGNGDPLGLFK